MTEILKLLNSCPVFLDHYKPSGIAYTWQKKNNLIIFMSL
jgi:hypothetical protein